MCTYGEAALAVKREAPRCLTPASLRAVGDTFNKLINAIEWSQADSETRAAIKDIRYALFSLRVENAEAGAGSARDWRDVAMFCSLRVYRFSEPEADLVRSVFELAEHGLSPSFEGQQWLCAIRDRLQARERQEWLDEIRRLLGRR
jgi:hypothetical protein